VTIIKGLSVRRFKADRGVIWQEGSSSKYLSTDGVGFRFAVTL